MLIFFIMKGSFIKNLLRKDVLSMQHSTKKYSNAFSTKFDVLEPFHTMIHVSFDLPNTELIVR